MGLILKNKIQELMAGYPTVSDKYNGVGGVNEGTDAIEFGKLVQYGSTTGRYKAITSTVTANDIAGFALATNVKLATKYPAGSETTKVLEGEAFTLLLNGYIAVKLGSAAVISDIKAGAQAYVDLSSGDILGVSSASATISALTGVTFTGEYEKQGTDYIAEICVK